MNVIANLSHPSSHCLNAAQLQAVGITTVAFNLADLLVKPGIEILQQISDLGLWHGWSGKWMLNLHGLEQTALISKFDGSKIILEKNKIQQLILQLAPPVVDVQYEIIDSSLSDVLIAINAHNLVATSLPCVDGSLGRFYAQEISYNIQDTAFALDNALLEANCTCPTCSQKCTRSYLHHLYTAVPLLAKRYLIQHNWGFLIRRSG